MKKLQAWLFMAALSLFGTAHAALPTAITDPTSGVFAVIKADALEMFNDYMWPLLAFFLGIWILVDIVKKGVKKSSK